MLAAAYAVQSVVPNYHPSAASALSFHGASCVWYALRDTRGFRTKWLRGVEGLRLSPIPPSFGTNVLFALGSALQFPVYAPCAVPFALCAVLGLEE